MFFLLLGKDLFLNVEMKEFLPILVKKSYVDGVMVTVTGLEHWDYLVIDINTDDSAYLLLIMNFGQ